MRAICAALIMLAASLPSGTAQADPYRWCAHYSGNGGNGTNCYFLTIEQCRAAVSGVGGSCSPNPFYTGATDRPASQRRPRNR